MTAYEEYGLVDRGFPESVVVDAISGMRGMITQPVSYLRSLRADFLGRDFLDRLRYHLTVAIEQGVFIIDSKGIIRFRQIIGPIGNIPGNEQLLRELEKSGN